MAKTYILLLVTLLYAACVNGETYAETRAVADNEAHNLTISPQQVG